MDLIWVGGAFFLNLFPSWKKLIYKGEVYTTLTEKNSHDIDRGQALTFWRCFL